MDDAAAQEEWRTKQVREWLLAILRFAVTLERADRAAALAAADELDRSRLCARQPAFSFFARTSTDVCNAIADKNDPRSVATLRRHLARIDDDRLRHTLEAAIGFEQPAKGLVKAKRRNHVDLWKGLRER